MLSESCIKEKISLKAAFDKENVELFLVVHMLFTMNKVLSMNPAEILNDIVAR